ncbi:MAG: hypothetical protein ABI367_12980 [Mucilaginibacter sp.]
MKKLLLVALMAIGVSAAVHAQGPPSPEEELSQLKTSLTLTDAQVAKVKPIINAEAKSRDSLFQGGDMQAAFPKMITLMNASSAKIKAMLTPEQATIYQKQLDQRAEMMKGFQNGGN